MIHCKFRYELKLQIPILSACRQHRITITITITINQYWFYLYNFLGINCLFDTCKK